jgi:hypothetical protein
MVAGTQYAGDETTNKTGYSSRCGWLLVPPSSHLQQAQPHHFFIDIDNVVSYGLVRIRVVFSFLDGVTP